MEVFNTLFGIPLGYILYGCYRLLPNYGVAILAFTIITKVVLFPLSLMAQRNAITMVRIKPQLEDIKRRFDGNNSLILEEQRSLYRREHYSMLKGVLPMLIQIPIILGLINVIYKPLQHLLHLDPPVVRALVFRTGELLGLGPGELGYDAQLRALEAVQANPAAFAGLSGLGDAIAQIQSIQLAFLGTDLAGLPALGSLTIVYPLLSALSALALCLYQNKYYILNRFQPPAANWAMTAFMVLFSGYFALVLPCGLGLYWTAGNLASILVVWLCNLVYPPAHHINFSRLPTPVRATKAERTDRRRQQAARRTRQSADIKRFHAIKDKQLVIYSEASGFWKYFARFIGYLLDHSDITIHYVTSDDNDQVFNRDHPRLKTYYVGPRALIAFMMRLDADMVIMTMPDLEKYHIKRSLVRQDIEYVYTDHGIGSFHLMLREGALDHFDTIFAYGPNHVTEVRQTEEFYDLPSKRLVMTGYGLLDDLLEAVADLDLSQTNDPPRVLIAPSWQPDNIIESCLDEVVQSLLDHDFQVIVRPHPEFVKRFDDKMAAILRRWRDEPTGRLEIQTDFSSNQTVYGADLVVTDWSSIAEEFSFPTKKPTIFINTPMKVMNHNWAAIETPPLEITLRDRIGVSLDLDEVSRIGQVAADLTSHPEQWQEQITTVVAETMFCVGHSAQAASDYIIASLEQHRRRRRAGGGRPAATQADSSRPAEEALAVTK